MATKQAQIIIAVDSKSLVQLNAEIKLLETSMKSLKVNSEAWIKQNEQLGELKTQFKAATDQAKLLQGQVQKISSSDQIRAVAKLGAGMVGAFAAVNGTLTALGVTNNKTMEEITAKGVQLMQIFGGLNQVAELFSRQTLTSLKGIALGFKSLTVSVRAFSTATKAALISTGIGALLVGIGILIANWDKLTAAIKRNNKEKDLAKDKVRLDAEIKAQETIIGLEEKRIADAKKLNELNDEEYKNSQLDYELAQKRIALSEETLKGLKNEAATLKLQKEEADKKVKSLEAQDRTETKRYAKAVDAQKAIEDAQKINKAAQESTIENLELQDETLGKILSKESLHLSLLEKSSQISKLEDQVKILEAQTNKTQEIYFLQQKILATEIQKIDEAEKYNGFLTDEEKIKRAGYQADIRALRIANDLRNKNLQIELNELIVQKKYDEALNIINNKLKESGEIIRKYNVELEKVNFKYENQKDFYNIILEKQKEFAQFEKESSDGVRKRLDYTRDYQSAFGRTLKMSKTEFEEQSKIFQAAGGTQEEFNNKYRAFIDEVLDAQDMILSISKDKDKLQQRDLENAARILAVQRIMTHEILARLNSEIIINSLKLDTVKNDEKLLESNKKINQAEINRLEGLKKTSQAEYDKAKTLELQKKYFTEIADYQSKINALSNDNLSIQIELTSNKQEQDTLNQDILQNDIDIQKTTSAIVIETTKVTNELDQQARIMERLQRFVNKYAEEIQIFRDAMQVIGNAFDMRVNNIRQSMENLSYQYDKMNEKEKDRLQEIDDLNAELADANGQRYDDILARLSELNDAKTEGYIDEKTQQENLKKLDDDRVEAEYKAAKWRKAQAIVDGLIQTTLAVIKALPNVFLAIATGVLGAAGVATIATQKLPPKPESKKEGGFTARALTDDVPIPATLHSNEYVVPAKVVRSPVGAAHIAALENMRTRSYADGGFVAPNVGDISQGFDYEKFAMVLSSAMAELPNPQVSLVAVDAGLKAVQLTKSNAGLTR